MVYLSQDFSLKDTNLWEKFTFFTEKENKIIELASQYLKF